MKVALGRNFTPDKDSFGLLQHSIVESPKIFAEPNIYLQPSICKKAG